jgi:hypothetical protein
MAKGIEFFNEFTLKGPSSLDTALEVKLIFREYRDGFAFNLIFPGLTRRCTVQVTPEQLEGLGRWIGASLQDRQRRLP